MSCHQTTGRHKGRDTETRLTRLFQCPDFTGRVTGSVNPIIRTPRSNSHSKPKQDLTPAGCFPKDTERKALGENQRHLGERDFYLPDNIKDNRMSFCEKLNLQQVDFREVHKDRQNPWSDKQGSVLSLRDGGHRNNHCGARQHRQMENRLERETGEEQKGRGSRDGISMQG